MLRSPNPPTRTRQRATSSSSRLHHLDALRGGALLLGVLLHALMPFTGDAWAVEDSHRSSATDVTVSVVHLFRMILFMLLAGFFGHMVVNRRGPGAYVRDRLKRIGGPLIAFWPVLMALWIVAVLVNQSVRGAAGLRPSPESGVTPAGILALPTMHLWFLLLLLEIVLVVVAVRAALLFISGPERTARAARAVGRLLASPVGVPILAVSYAAGLATQYSVRRGIVEPYTLVPVLGASIAYSTAFLAGWFLRSHPLALDRIQRQWVVQLPVAAVTTVLSLVLPSSAPTLVVCAVTAVAGWSWVYGLLGLTARVLDREIPVVRYLADSSYWVYLMHLPLLLLVEVPLADLGLPIAVKLAIALAAVLGVLLISYDLLVRSTWLGRWLTGHRRPRVLFAAR